jgi:uncharacterized protein YndB with AHSA1/START domain
MTPATDAVTPVRKTIDVNAGLERAFSVFTDGFDSWWPRSHHIGKQPMECAIIETRTGGRLYSRQIDGTECDWGRVLVWEPPRRLVMAWQITHQWGFEPDLAKASEVEIVFTPLGPNLTRVDLEHRHFERHGAGAMSMRTAVDSPTGWGGLLQLFADRVNQPSASGA